MGFIDGYLLGLGMIIFIGPVFFLLLSITLQYGLRPGMFVAFGIFVSDIICVILCSLGIHKFLDNPNINLAFILIGSVLLIALGIKYIFTKVAKQEDQIVFGTRHFFSFFVRGFLVNFVNPFVFLVWIGVVIYANNEFHGSLNRIFYFSGALAAIFTTDSLKVFLAKQIKSRLTPNVLEWAYKISGIILIGFGIRTILHARILFDHFLERF